MGTFRVSKDFIAYEILDVTSESGGFFSENLKDREHPKRAWRSTGLGEQEIEIDLLSSRDEPEIHVEMSNVSEIEYKGSDDGETWDGASGTIEIEKDEKQGVYRHGGPLKGFGHRYIKIVVPVQEPIDGAAFYSIGGISFMGSTQGLVANPSMGLAFAEGDVDGHRTNSFESGGKEVFRLTEVMPMSLQLSLRQPFKDGSSALVWDMFRNKADIVYINFGLGKSWQAYLVRRATPIREARDSYSYVQFDNMTVDVVV